MAENDYGRSNEKRQRYQRGTMIAGLAVIGLVVVGVGSISAAFFSLVGYSDFVGGGIFALAAALAFGQLLGGLFRN